ncbi:hypothetical protein BpHYR1_003632 [Brachionus plicatilis]|uniref:Uncharacterized protein n=1 Tax=Brachionus plicatilis TaxID=10195 RepID=A0A3M7PD70_BRAPC|nr:hypothetical protein BpHYR1_003632 [Brachionus plicatilis]
MFKIFNRIRSIEKHWNRVIEKWNKSVQFMKSIGMTQINHLMETPILVIQIISIHSWLCSANCDDSLTENKQDNIVRVNSSFNIVIYVSFMLTSVQLKYSINTGLAQIPIIRYRMQIKDLKSGTADILSFFGIIYLKTSAVSILNEKSDSSKFLFNRLTTWTKYFICSLEINSNFLENVRIFTEPFKNLNKLCVIMFSIYLLKIIILVSY